MKTVSFEVYKERLSELEAEETRTWTIVQEGKDISGQADQEHHNAVNAKEEYLLKCIPVYLPDFTHEVSETRRRMIEASKMLREAEIKMLHETALVSRFDFFQEGDSYEKQMRRENHREFFMGSDLANGSGSDSE